MKSTKNRMAIEIAKLRVLSLGGNILANASARAMRVVLFRTKQGTWINGEAMTESRNKDEPFYSDDTEKTYFIPDLQTLRWGIYK